MIKLAKSYPHTWGVSDWKTLIWPSILNYSEYSFQPVFKPTQADELCILLCFSFDWNPGAKANFWPKVGYRPFRLDDQSKHSRYQHALRQPVVDSTPSTLPNHGNRPIVLTTNTIELNCLSSTLVYDFQLRKGGEHIQMQICRSPALSICVT